MKQLRLYSLCAALLAVAACGGNNNPPQIIVQQPAGATTPVVEAPQAGLDLQALGELVRQAPNQPAELEKMVNDSTRGINNLDLNQDGQVDYVVLKEVSDGGTKSFKFFDTAVDPAREVATVTVQASSNAGYAQVNLIGDPGIYGPNYSLSFEQRLADAAFLNYMFMPHPYYYSPYHYGYYPTYYRPIRVVPYRAYTNRVQTITRTSTIRRVAPRTTTASSSQAPTRPAPAAPRSVSGSTTTQRSFESRPATKPIASGGFGRPSTPSTTRPAAPRPSTSTSRPATRSAPPPARRSPPSPPRRR